MSVDADTVRRIAHLARIKVADEEIEPLRGELNAILAFVEQLSAVNVDGVEPMISVIPMRMQQRERAERRARGETSPPNANWLWPVFTTAPQSSPGAAKNTTRDTPKPGFVCDAPE